MMRVIQFDVAKVYKVTAHVKQIVTNGGLG
jgi:hypothetical protein